jgi:hypothetical protein
MGVHKFILKQPRVPSKPPAPVVWHPYENLQHPPVQLDEFKWLVYLQEDITIAPHNSNILILQLGDNLSMGVVLISLDDKLKAVRCSLMNESTAAPANNIITIIQNNFYKIVTINKGNAICYLTFINLFK